LELGVLPPNNVTAGSTNARASSSRSLSAELWIQINMVQYVRGSYTYT
jgi:hypothetical protein